MRLDQFSSVRIQIMTESNAHRLQKGKPALNKPVTGELGCTTPYVVVPGAWSRSDLEYHARGIATGKTHNAGHNCLAAELIVTAADWPQRDEFLDILRWGPLESVRHQLATCKTQSPRLTPPASPMKARQDRFKPSPQEQRRCHLSQLRATREGLDSAINLWLNNLQEDPRLVASARPQLSWQRVAGGGLLQALS